MKRVIVVMMLILFLFSLLGCRTRNSDFIEPVNFYYCNNLDSKEDFENVFVAEVREGAGFADNRPALLSLYLSGPQDDHLVSPFPAGTTIISVKKDGDSLQIVFSDHLAQLTGLQLTLATTCISMTALELYSCSQIQLCCKEALLDGKALLRMSSDDLVLTDNAYSMVDD